MKLQYDDSIDEAADVQYELAELTGAIASRKWVGSIVPVLVVVVTLFVFWNSPLKLIAGLILAAFVLGLDLFTYKNKIRHSFRKSLIKIRGSDSPVMTEYELDESGIRIRQLGQEMKFDWSTVVGFHCTPERIRLVLRPPGIVVIPARAFTSVQQREDWINKIQSLVTPTA